LVLGKFEAENIANKSQQNTKEGMANERLEKNLKKSGGRGYSGKLYMRLVGLYRVHQR